ncbi:hypothetical protein E8P77_22335 [Soehngenia saccharolytica]|nr:hypothetical protein E8P77_22335 [Soehngenia saccharolytica]
MEIGVYLDETYDIDSVKDIYLAGDEANWIKSGLSIIKGNKYVKIITAHTNSLENPININKPLWNNIKRGNKKQTMEIINFAIEETPIQSGRV